MLKIPLFGTWYLSFACTVTSISQDLEIPQPTWCLLWSPTLPTLAEDKLFLISLWRAPSSKFTQEVLGGQVDGISWLPWSALISIWSALSLH